MNLSAHDRTKYLLTAENNNNNSKIIANLMYVRSLQCMSWYVQKVYKKLLKMQLDRKSLIIFLERVSLVTRTFKYKRPIPPCGE